VGQFVDAMKTSITMDLLVEVHVKLIVRMMVLLFQITYNHCSGHLMLLHEILPQVMARKCLILFVSFHVAQQHEYQISHINFVGVWRTCHE
jgi:hypothetical protein